MNCSCSGFCGDRERAFDLNLLLVSNDVFRGVRKRAVQ